MTLTWVNLYAICQILWKDIDRNCGCATFPISVHMCVKGCFWPSVSLMIVDLMDQKLLKLSLQPHSLCVEHGVMAMLSPGNSPHPSHEAGDSSLSLAHHLISSMPRRETWRWTENTNGPSAQLQSSPASCPMSQVDNWTRFIFQSSFSFLLALFFSALVVFFLHNQSSLIRAAKVIVLSSFKDCSST